MPERREEIEEIAQAERQAAVLSASIAQIRSALETLSEMEIGVSDLSSEFVHLVELAGRLQREFRNLNADNLPRVRALIHEISQELSQLNIRDLVNDLDSARDKFLDLAQRASLMKELEFEVGFQPVREEQPPESNVLISQLINALQQVIQQQPAQERVIERRDVERTTEREHIVEHQVTPQIRQSDWDRVNRLLENLGVSSQEVRQELRQAVEKNDLTELSRIMRDISSQILDIRNDIPESVRNIIGEDVLRQYSQAVREGASDSVERLAYVIRDRLNNITKSVTNLTRGLDIVSEHTDWLPQLARTVRRTGLTMSQLLDRYATRLMSEAGLGGLYSTVKELVTLFRSGVGKLAVIAAIFEVIQSIYKFLQQSYMEGRRYIATTQLPGAGVMTAFAQAGYTQEQITTAVRSIALQFQNYMDRAYRDLRLPQQEYYQILQQLKQSGLMLEGTFQGLNTALLMQRGRINEAMQVSDELVRRFYSLSYATGLSYNTLMNGTRQMMRLMGTHDIERALNTFVAINEIGTRFGISGNLMLEWITNATQELRWFGYALTSNVNVLTRYSDALYKGMVQVQDFTRAVETFTGRNQQVEALGFVTALNQPGELGDVLRRTLERGGLFEALSLFRTLASSSIETLREAAQRNNIAGEAARELLQRANIEQLIQEARRTQLEGTERLAREIGGGPFTSLEVFKQITGMNENIAKIADKVDAAERYFSQRPLDRVYRGLTPLTNMTRLTEATEGMLGASKNISQHLVSIKTMLRSLVNKIVFGGAGAVIAPHITRPGSR